MKRKLVRQGTATLMVSLPAKWIHENHLDKGSEIELEELDRDLMISAQAVKPKSEARIRINSSTESFIRIMITNTYRCGYDRILVQFEDEKQFQQLNQIVKTSLVGFEITKKEKNSCIIENITEPSDELFDNLLNKILYSISELFEFTQQMIEKPQRSSDYQEIEERIQKYDNFCRRVISKRKLRLSNTELLWNFLVLVNHGQRELYHFNRQLQKDIQTNSKLSFNIEFKSILRETSLLFDLIKKAYLEKKIDYLSRIHDLEKEIIYKKSFELMQNKKSKDNLLLYRIMVAAREFYLSSSPLVGIII